MNTLGSPAFISASITATSCGNPATGTVTFFAGATQVGSSNVQSSVDQSKCTLSGSAAATATNLPLGISSITAKYSGDTNYAASTSAAATTDVQITTATSVATSASTINQFQSITFTATIAPGSGGGPAMTGNVRFMSSGAATALCTVAIANGQAQCATTALPAGQQTITATYAGDTNYATSAGIVNVTVNPGPDFSLAASPASITITKPGQSGSTSLMLSAMNGLTGTFTLAPQCANLPSESACSVSPASVTFSSTTTTASVMLTVTTTAPSSVAPARHLGRPINTGPREGSVVVLCLLTLLSILYVVERRKRLEVALSILAFAALLTIAACGGGGGGGVHDPGTPVGLDTNATVSFTLGPTTHSIPFTVNVQ